MHHAKSTLAEVLALKLHEIKIEDIADEVRLLATGLFVDTVGVTLLGMTDTSVSVLQSALKDQCALGPASVIGSDIKLNILDAALINGAAAHAADYDDMASAMAGGGHPSAVLVPTVLAVGESVNATGAQVLEAYIVGFEAACRLGRVVHWHHYEKGWHPTSTLGVFASAMAAVRLLGVSIHNSATALGIAASFASGVKANFGSMTKPLHVGHCARNGVFSAQLAANGFSSNLAAIEHRQGFLATFNGLSNARPEYILDDWGKILEIEKAGVGAKQFPCCGSTHAAIRAVLKIRNMRVPHKNIESITVTENRRRVPHTDNPNPTTGTQAKFSVQYVVARAFIDGVVRLEHFEENAFMDPYIRSLMQKIKIETYPPAPIDDSGDENNAFAADVQIRWCDGDIRTASTPNMLGRGALDPMTSDEQWEKYQDCASRLLNVEKARKSYEMLNKLETVAQISEITSVLRA